MTAALLLLLSVFAPNLESTERDVEADEVLCDDGAPGYDEDGQPNWACTREGCSPEAAICWADRLAYCVGDAGETGSCRTEVEECHTRLSCFDLWLHCRGVYKCHTSGGIGCTFGTCETANEPPEHETSSLDVSQWTEKAR